MIDFQQIESSDLRATAELLPHVYDELRNLAAARIAWQLPESTLWSMRRMSGWSMSIAQQWDSRGHFFAEAAEAIRRSLVCRALRSHASGMGACINCWRTKPNPSPCIPPDVATAFQKPRYHARLVMLA